MMKNNSLFFITLFQKDPTELLNCSKQFTIGRWYDLKFKNKIYLRDGRIKVMNCYHPIFDYIMCKEIWYKNSKIHCDEVDPETGLTLPDVVWNDGTLTWYKDGEYHRDEVDSETGLIFPAVIDIDGTKYWFKNGIEQDPPQAV